MLWICAYRASFEAEHQLAHQSGVAFLKAVSGRSSVVVGLCVGGARGVRRTARASPILDKDGREREKLARD
jgi:hypothetical protein